MRFNFKIQEYQTEAVEAVVSVFAGQPRQEITYLRDLGRRQNANEQQTEAFDDAEYEATGFRNADLVLTDDELLQNIRQTQMQRNINVSSTLSKEIGRCQLDVEMETGTGKTYVYVKTMFELYRQYGWSKFIVVVPSIAIREGVKKSMEMTVEHFMEHYGRKARFFIYNSANLTELDHFSKDSGINVMIINTQAFAASMKEGGKSKDSRIIYSKRDEFQSRRPIDVIKANRPIVILDEPQKMGGAATQAGIRSFNPLFTLNYSATHRNHHNEVYVLDALDAYKRRLVKKIQVKGFEIHNLRGTDGYVYLERIVVSPNKPPMAMVEFEVKQATGVVRKRRLLGRYDNLYAASGELEQYRHGYVIEDIDPITARLTFSGNRTLHTGEVHGDISETDMRRIQIRETILSHFQKEAALFERGIKTLSLFFIDEVSKYRQYGEDGEELPGEYARMFEEEYMNVMNDNLDLLNPEYRQYLTQFDVHQIHRGYFSIDKKGRVVNSETKRGSDISDDISAYDLILKNKERLLDFGEPCRFIFSHSALREGWDNPNVFQICTLKHSDSATAKRQEVGRGLRLCVDQNGVRQDAMQLGAESVHDVNKLTVIASESYAGFVNDLQSETREVLYDRPKLATTEYFAGKTVKAADGTMVEISNVQAASIMSYLFDNDYIDERGNILPQYHQDLASNSLAAMPKKLEALTDSVHRLVQGVFDSHVLDDMIENANETTIDDNRLNDNFKKREFQELWRRINHKYAYTVHFDSEELIRNAIAAINTELNVTQVRYSVTTGEQQTDLDFGVSQTSSRTLRKVHACTTRYDLIGKVAQGTKITRRTAAAIIGGISSAKRMMYALNPEEFIAGVIKRILEQKATMIVDDISYNQIEGEYDSTIFTQEKHTAGFMNAMPTKKHITDYLFTDSKGEKEFAGSLDVAKEVCVYAKLPKGFHIPTPVGNYSPDWAISFNEGTVKHVFFIAETKGSVKSMELRQIEIAKIRCAKRLFNEISTENVRYHEVDNYQHLLEVIENMR